MEDWFYQMANPLKIKNLLTYFTSWEGPFSFSVFDNEVYEYMFVGVFFDG